MEIANSPGSQKCIPSVSVIVPFFNEGQSVKVVLEELVDVLKNHYDIWEIITVDDGSFDDTYQNLRDLGINQSNIKILSFVRNFGQTAAMMAGIDHARHDIIVGMDGDGQNDPSSIPALVSKLEDGFDVVSGWRLDRKDKPFSRKLPSKIANIIISRLGGVKLNDYGCSLKAYRKEFIKPVRLYGEMHRFIPIYTAWQGGKITELPVGHRAREAGTSKYGLNRIFKVLLDMAVIRFLHSYLSKPIYVFGGIGFFCFFLAAVSGLWALGLKFISGVSFIATPLPLVVVMFSVTGTLSILMGLLAEIVVRIYYESQGLRPYQLNEPKSLNLPTGNGSK